MRRLVTVLVIAVATLPVPARGASVPVLVVDGRGFGHGVGMAQDGAYWMGVGGSRVEEILGHFYPGTNLGRGQGKVRVVVHDAGRAPTGVVVVFPGGGELRDAPTGAQSEGFPVRVQPGGAARIVWDGARYRVEVAGGTVALGRTKLASSTRPQVSVPSTTTSTTAPPAGETTTTTAPDAPPESTTTTTAAPTTTTARAQEPESSRPIWAVPVANGTIELPARARRYRGVLHVGAPNGSLRVVNEVDVETYLKGMGEVRDPRWPLAGLKAQAIAARTYALRAMSIGGEICDTQLCQVYLGAQAEYAAMNRAVDETRGQVLVHGRQLVSAVYSANGGGHSASREEGFGVSAEDRSFPYLRSAPYPTRDPLPWSVTVALETVAARVGYRGEVASVTATKIGPSGRVLEVTIDGSAGPKAVAGIAFDAALGLKSTLFTLRIDAADEPPPTPPAPDQLIQAPPDQAVAAVAAAPDFATPAPPAARAPAEVAAPPPRRSNATYVAAIVAGWTILAVAGAALLSLPRRRGDHFA